MIRFFTTSAAVSVLMFGLASAALARTGEYQNMDAMMLVHGQAVHTNCSFMAMIGGKDYCFGSQQAMQQFMQHPRRNIRRADAAYRSLQ
jgi:YHS domain-containing protein